ncbi:MAG: gluconate 2-dehydrogenase subunit 3 family protein [Bacteroidetes bacterium]|nr:gluconate 2-dehydrogenase subunit 3 family protein [Bacteroidota bacterium]
MIIHRRSLLKQLLFVSATAAFAPSCLLDKHKTGIPLKHMTVSPEQEAAFASLLATIIPETDTPGAASMHADLFAWKMLDDCSPKSEQDKILKGLNELNLTSQTKFGQFFNRLTEDQRIQIVTDLESNKDKSNSLVAFYRQSKGLALHAYTSSEFYLTKVQVYEQIPGRFHGCVKA